MVTITIIYTTTMCPLTMTIETIIALTIMLFVTTFYLTVTYLTAIMTDYITKTTANVYTVVTTIATIIIARACATLFRFTTVLLDFKS